MQEIIIRQANREDVPRLAALLKELFAIEEDFSFDREKAEKGLRLLIEDDRAAVLVADAEGTPVGMVTSQLMISTAEGGTVATLEDMVVSHAYRRHGIGEKLMRACEQWSASKGATRVQLLADRNNTPAIAFYRRLGWESTALVAMRTLNPGEDA